MQWGLFWIYFQNCVCGVVEYVLGVDFFDKPVKGIISHAVEQHFEETGQKQIFWVQIVIVIFVIVFSVFLAVFFILKDFHHLIDSVYNQIRLQAYDFFHCENICENQKTQRHLFLYILEFPDQIQQQIWDVLAHKCTDHFDIFGAQIKYNT